MLETIIFGRPIGSCCMAGVMMAVPPEPRAKQGGNIAARQDKAFESRRHGGDRTAAAGAEDRAGACRMVAGNVLWADIGGESNGRLRVERSTVRVGKFRAASSRRTYSTLVLWYLLW